MWFKEKDAESTSYYLLKGESQYKLFNKEKDLKLIKDGWHFFYESGGQIIRKQVSTGGGKLKLPDGIYILNGQPESDQWLTKMESTSKEFFLELEGFNLLNKEYNNFIQSKNFYKKLKMIHKRSILLYGPPGTGKSSAIKNLINSQNNDNVLIIYIRDYLSGRLRDALYKDTRLKIFIFEEITEILCKRGSSHLLSFFDGEDNLDNTFIITTTNYPEKLPENFVNRRGRFDRMFNIGYLTKEEIKKYLLHTLSSKINDKNVEQTTVEMLDIIKNVTTADLKEIVLTSITKNISLKEASKIIETMNNTVAASFKPPTAPIGFKIKEL